MLGEIALAEVLVLGPKFLGDLAHRRPRQKPSARIVGERVLDVARRQATRVKFDRQPLKLPRAPRTQIAAGVDGGLDGGRRDRAGVLPGPALQRAQDPLLAVSDGASGIIRAIGERFPRSARQRCLAHRMRNLAAKVSADPWPEYKARVTACYQAPLAGDCTPIGDRHPRRLRQRPAERARLLRR